MLTFLAAVIATLLLWIALNTRYRATHEAGAGTEFSVRKNGEVISVKRFEVIEAKQFHLLDDSGGLRGTLSASGGTAGLVLGPRDGEPTVHILAPENGGPSVVLSRGGVPVLELRATTAGSVQTAVTLKNNAGRVVASVLVQEDGSGQIFVWEPATGEIAFAAP